MRYFANTNSQNGTLDEFETLEDAKEAAYDACVDYYTLEEATRDNYELAPVFAVANDEMIDDYNPENAYEYADLNDVILIIDLNNLDRDTQYKWGRNRIK